MMAKKVEKNGNNSSSYIRIRSSGKCNFLLISSMLESLFLYITVDSLGNEVKDLEKSRLGECTNYELFFSFISMAQFCARPES